MKKSVLLMCIIALTLGCSEDPTSVTLPNVDENSIAVENGRLVFKDFRAYSSTISALNKMDNEGLKKWDQQFRFNSLNQSLASIDHQGPELSSDMEEYFEFPTSHWHVLNSQGEVKIGDDIIWYNKGVRHAVPSEDDLLMIKANPEKSLKKETYTISYPKFENDANAEKRLEIGHGQGYSGNGLVFNHCYNNGVKRYINDMLSFAEVWFADGEGFVYQTTLFLRLRLHYRSSGNWYPEKNDVRLMKWNLSTDIESWDIRGDVTHRVQDFVGEAVDLKVAEHRVLLFDDLKWGRSNDIGGFKITLNGTITQALLFPLGPGHFYCNWWDDTWNL
jgi:hypothetical protein